MKKIAIYGKYTPFSDKPITATLLALATLAGNRSDPLHSPLAPRRTPPWPEAP